jgi:hypothetical protein
MMMRLACQPEISHIRDRNADFGMSDMVTDSEREWAHRARRFLRAEIKRAEISYAELARRLCEEHGLQETEASIANKLARGTFAATFFLATMKAIGREQVNLQDI